MIKGINQGSIHSKPASNPRVLFYNISPSVNQILKVRAPAKNIHNYTISEDQMIINMQLLFLRRCKNRYFVLIVNVFKFYGAEECIHFTLGTKMISKSRGHIDMLGVQKGVVNEMEDHVDGVQSFLLDPRCLVESS